MKKLTTTLIALLFFSPITFANGFKEDHPEQYVVQPGDSLWEIAGKFLNDPAAWTDLWQHNSSIENPDLIYPGDVITVVWRDGKPYLTINGKDPEQLPVKKLSPKVRSSTLVEAIPTIPMKAIRPFLDKTRVIEKDGLENAPRVLANVDEHIITGRGDKVFVAGLDYNNPATEYFLYRPGDAYVDPETNEVLGYEARYVGALQLIAPTIPAKFLITDAKFEVMRGDRLEVAEENLIEPQFPIRRPTTADDGYIISVFDGVSQVGQYQVVAVTGGQYRGRMVGDVLNIYKDGRRIKQEDSLSSNAITLPPVKAGEMVIFQVFNKVSLGLIMQANLPIAVKDKISRI